MRNAALPMLARTHGQTASPTTLGKEIANVVARLRRAAHALAAVRDPGKINGAVGNYNAHVDRVSGSRLAARSSQRFVAVARARLQRLHDADRAARLDRRVLAMRVRRVNTVLIDLCRDIWGYISLGYFKQAVEGRRSRLLDHAAQGQPDRFRECRRQSSASPTRCWSISPKSCRSAAGSATSPTRPCCARSAPRSATRWSRSMRCCAGWASSASIPSASPPTSTPAGKCWPKPCRP